MNDWFDIKAIVQIGEFNIPFIKFKKNIISNKREFILPNGELFILPEEWFTRFKSIFEFAEIDKEIIKVHKQHFSLVNEAIDGTNESIIQKLEKLSKAGDIPEAKLPKGINAELRPYQMEGYTWMLFLKEQGLGGCLADDMGLGKTLQPSATAKYQRKQPKRNYQQTKQTNLVCLKVTRRN